MQKVSCMLLCLLFAAPATAQELLDKRLTVCESVVQARHFIETDGLKGCATRVADYTRGKTVDTMTRNGVFYKIIEVTLIRSYDGLECPRDIRYSIVYPIEYPEST